MAQVAGTYCSVGNASKAVHLHHIFIELVDLKKINNYPSCTIWSGEASLVFIVNAIPHNQSRKMIDVLRCSAAHM